MLFAVAATGSGFLLLGPSLIAEAEVGGPGCSAHITNQEGVPVDVAAVDSQDSSTAIPVTLDQTVDVDLAGETGTPRTVHVDYGLTDRLAIGRDGTGTRYSARVSDYAHIAGLYLVRARTAPNGTCTAAALVDVQGNPLGTPIGDAALALTIGAAAAVGISSAAAATGDPGVRDPDRPGGAASPDAVGGAVEQPDPLHLLDPDTGQPWTSNQLAHLADLRTQYGEGEAAMWAGATPAERQSIDLANGFIKPTWLTAMVGCLVPAILALLLLPVLMVVRTLFAVGPVGEALAAPARVAPLRLPRTPWRPYLSVSAISGGVVGAVGVVVLLQEYGRVFPTTGILVRAVAVGLVVGIALPSLARGVRVARANRRTALIEARANEARARVAAHMGAALTPVLQRTSAESAAVYAPTHIVPSLGLDAWTDPDPSRAPVDRLDEGLDVEVVERWGGWARVVCSNGWLGWVDGAALQELRR